MTPERILTVIVAISVAGYLFDLVLETLNIKARRTDIPDDVALFYDREKYLKSLEYHRVKTKFSFLSGGFGFLLSLGMLLSGGFGYVDSLLRLYIHSEIWLSLAFFGVILLASDILSLPFQLWSTFVIEERFGFNKTTKQTFIADKIKGYIIGGLVGGALLALLIVMVNKFGPGFWIWFAVISSVVVLAINMFYTSWILPLFNKLTVLPQGELKSAIENFSRKVSFPLDNVFVMDGSKRSSKANAFFSGIGRKKKIVLYDTLINNHTTEELVAVLAHEVGHFKKKHIILSFVLSVIQIFFLLFVLSLMIFNADLSLALGGTQQAIHLNLIAFAILFSPVSGVTGLLMSLLSRKNEYEADAYAKETYNGAALSAALKRLSVDTLSNLYPHPAYVFFYYSHPTLLQRLQALKG
jgi:STE24 endopeptidase